MVDTLEAAGIPAFGPRADAAIIEASKSFSKRLMEKYHIPTAKYQTFTELEPALAYIEAQGAPIVVKADGLALGKGVIVAQTVAEAQDAVRSMMSGHKFGDAGALSLIHIFYDRKDGFQRQIHNIENTPFRTKFDKDLSEFHGCAAIGCISDTDPQPLLVRSHPVSYTHLRSTPCWAPTSPPTRWCPS